MKVVPIMIYNTKCMVNIRIRKGTNQGQINTEGEIHSPNVLEGTKPNKK